jgi:hypothetical protein
MSDVRKSLGIGALALLPIACCIGLPLIVAAGIGAAALAWGGAVVGAVVIATAAAFLVLRRRARTQACRRPLVERPSPQGGSASETREEVVQR